MAVRRSRRLAGLSPEVLDDVNEPKSIHVSFTGTLIGMMAMTAAVVFVAFWK